MEFHYEDCEIWFSTNAGVQIDGTNNIIRRSPGYFDRHHGRRARHLLLLTNHLRGSYPASTVNDVYDSPNYGSGEDNCQVQIKGAVSSNPLGDTVAHVDDICAALHATSPKSMWIYQFLGELQLDIKNGRVECSSALG